MVKIVFSVLAIVLAFSCNAAAQQTVLFDFYSPSCGPCRQMDPVVGQLKAAGYPVRKVNIVGTAAEKAIAAEFGVQKVPTFVMVAGGWEAGRVVGATSYGRLEQMVKQAQAKVDSASALAGARTQSPDPPARENPWRRDSQPWPSTTQSAPTSAGPSVYGQRNPQAPQSVKLSPVERKLLSTTVRLKITDSQGRNGGTGTIIDTRQGEALILTCGHIFRELERGSQIIVELYEALPTGVRVIKQVPGQVEAFDLESDIGLVSFRPGTPVEAARIAQPNQAAAEGDEVSTAGCSLGADPTVEHSRVTAVNRYLGHPNVEVAGAPEEGRSGGGLFNSRGELVGVCQAADAELDEGLYASLPAIYKQLEEIGLAGIFIEGQSASETPPLASRPPAPLKEPDDRLIRAQGALAPVAPVAKVQPGDHEDRPLSTEEQAAWDEIMEVTDEAEVVCIIRPKTPGGKSQIIRLSKASGRFVQRLVERSNASQ